MFVSVFMLHNFVCAVASGTDSKQNMESQLTLGLLILPFSYLVLVSDDCKWYQQTMEKETCVQLRAYIK